MRAGNYLEEIDRHWIQHIDDYDTRNKNYRDDDHNGYAITMGSFHIAGALGRPRFIEDGNNSLMTMGMQKNYVNTKYTEGSSLIIDEIEVYMFTVDTPQDNEN